MNIYSQNDSDVGYIDPEWMDFKWDPIQKVWVNKDETIGEEPQRYNKWKLH